jgi:antirestriction protein
MSKAPENVKTLVGPSIYVADLAAYNSAILFGKWIPLEGKDSDEVYEEINAMLAEGTKLYSEKHTLNGPHEEFAIHDYEGFGTIKVGEYDSISDLVDHVERMDDDPDKYFAYIDAHGEHYAENYDPDEVYGPFDREEDYAWEMLDMIIGDKTLSAYLESKGIPESLAMTIKFDAKDYMFSGGCNGEFATGTYNGKHYVFLSC